MIGHLTGKIIEKTIPNTILLDIQGVGYQVELPLSSFTKLPLLNETISLHIQHILREDASILYGFLTREEREAFRLLIKVTGIGPKSAIVILSGLTPIELHQVIENEDITHLTKVPGVGKKTAERLILELRDKTVTLIGGATEAGSKDKEGSSQRSSVKNDAILALESLGYGQKLAQRMVQKVLQKAEVASVDEVIRLALQNTMK